MRTPRALLLFLFSALSSIVPSAPLTADSSPEMVSPVTLQSVEGAKVKIDFATAKLTLVNFWATWCMPCREEIPDIARLMSRYKEDGLQVYGIAMESGEVAEVKDFLQRNKAFGVNYPMLMGTDEISDAFGGVMAVPTTYLVDGKGRIVKKRIGVTSDFHKAMSADIEQFLGAAGSGKKAAAAP
jgi:thiol-disulfide isomerase/thioredoxin